MKKYYSAADFIEKFIINGLSTIVKDHPYQAFPLLAIAIEVLGKCLNSDDWQTSGQSEHDFTKAITTYDSFVDYRDGKYTHPKIDKKGNLVYDEGNLVMTCELYNTIRCGMLHSFLPKSGVQLIDKGEDLASGIVGCHELYHRIQGAWNEIKTGKVTPLKNMTDITSFYVDNALTGTTIETQTIVSDS